MLLFILIKQDYKQAEDPRLFKSKLTGRGPLGPNWKETADPVMTCYKLVTCEFKFTGITNKVENLIQNVSGLIISITSAYINFIIFFLNHRPRREYF